MARTASSPTLPSSRRLLRSSDFRRVYRWGKRARGANIVLVALPRKAPDFRLGVSVSKQHGNAVRRNKIKRVFREAFRLERPAFPGQLDMVMIPQPRERYELGVVRSELIQLVRQVWKAQGDRRQRQ